jgi:hypothetical protein
MGLLSCDTVKSMSKQNVRPSDKATKAGLTQSLLKTAAATCETNIMLRDVEKYMQNQSIFGHTDYIVNGVSLKTQE